MGPQEIVLNIQLCGDWAGNAWPGSACSWSTGVGPATTGCRGDIWHPASDCCTEYVTSPYADFALRETAFFDIEWVKVFTVSGAASQPHLSGTFQRGGVPLKRP